MRLLTTLFHDTLQPMAPGGRRVTESRDDITRYLEESLSPAHAALFADCVHDSTLGSSGWYTALDGDVQPYDTAPPEARARAFETLQDLRRDIQAEAERLLASGRRGDQMLSRLLSAALEVPDTRSIYIVGDRPVLAGWGYVQHGDGSPRGIIGSLAPPRLPATRRGVAIPPTAALPGPGSPVSGVGGVIAATWPRSPLSWATVLLWLLLALLLAAILLSLLGACGIRLPGGIGRISIADRCPVAATRYDGGALATEARRMAALESRLAQLETGLQERIGACEVDVIAAQAVPETPPPPVVEQPPLDVAEDTPPPPESLEPPQEDDFDQRVQEQGGQTDQDTMITLTWDSDDDLDLSLRCPSGREVSFRSPTACGARLDVDVNVQNVVRAPVENIVFAAPPPSGRYDVMVNAFKVRSSGRRPIPYRVRIVVGGQSRVVQGVLTPPHRKQVVASFTVP